VAVPIRGLTFKLKQPSNKSKCKATTTTFLGVPDILLGFNRKCGCRRTRRIWSTAAGCSFFRELYILEDIHLLLRLLAYQRGGKLSECAIEALDKAMPKWNVERIG